LRGSAGAGVLFVLSLGRTPRTASRTSSCYVSTATKVQRCLKFGSSWNRSTPMKDAF